MKSYIKSRIASLALVISFVLLPITFYLPGAAYREIQRTRTGNSPIFISKNKRSPYQELDGDHVQLSGQDISKYLNFSERSVLNFMHFHKTGGVSFKSCLYEFFFKKAKKNGELVRVKDLCSGDRRWGCGWKKLKEMSEKERNKFDVLFGHQYWGGGLDELLNLRDLRTFTIMRHPFDRKVSFFYHFIIRVRGRKDTDVSYEEIRDFILYNKINDKSFKVGQDLGPNYMAGRLLSDGEIGFAHMGNYGYFDVKPQERSSVIDQALGIIRKYAFVGLQSENAASNCMLRKTVKHFNNAHGIHNEEIEQVAAPTKNTGSYLLTAKKIWELFTMDEKILFGTQEKVDLAIYAEGENLFKQQAHLFRCSKFIKQEHLRND